MRGVKSQRNLFSPRNLLNHSANFAFDPDLFGVGLIASLGAATTLGADGLDRAADQRGRLS
jgi:hypothetical protein